MRKRLAAVATGVGLMLVPISASAQVDTTVPTGSPSTTTAAEDDGFDDWGLLGLLGLLGLAGLAGRRRRDDVAVRREVPGSTRV